MKTMSDYIGKLEAFPDLEVSIIRSTKINKVLKAIIKLDSIPKGDEFQFKDRSQKLLNKWNQLLAVDEKPSGEGANGVNGSSAELSKKSPEPATKAKTNGVKETSEDVPEGTKDSDKKDSEDAGDKAEDKADEKAEKETVEEVRFS
jgi:N-acetylmuramoyl-L-alanine amidase CwlA